MEPLTHIDENGNARMVNVNNKAISDRTATASGKVIMQKDTLLRIKQGGVKKGDVLTVAQIAGINAAKHCWEMIPLCHNIPLSGAEVSFAYESETVLVVAATVTATAQTGAEMEALAAVTVACLTVYDMCKAMDRGMTITDVKLLHKSGGKSGEFFREEL